MLVVTTTRRMNKGKVLEALEISLEAELKNSIGASREAADYATDEESRAESQWDTQGLEASYLAAGQASQARQWAEALEMVRRGHEILLAPKDEVVLGALVTCDFGDSRECFYLAPVAGGHVLEVDGVAITVITPQSPIGKRMIGKRAGEGFTLANGNAAAIAAVS